MTASANADTGLQLRLESTGIPCERLRIRKLSGGGAISRLFAYDLEVVCLDRGGLDPEALLGAPVTLVFEPRAGESDEAPETTRVHGMISELHDLLDTHSDVRAYRLRVSPRAFRLTLAEVQDIFLDASIPGLVEQKLAAVGLDAGDVAFRLSGSYEPRDFVVQYRETDLAFVSRLTEHLGISFFFTHEGDVDQIVFTDFAEGFGAAGQLPVIPYRGRGQKRDVFALEARHRMIPTFYVVRDYNYRKPHVELTAEHTLATGYAGGVIEYGTHHKTPEQGRALAKARAEEHQSSQLVYTGRSTLPGLQPGKRFRLTGHPDADPLELLVVDCQHEATQALGSGGAEGEGTYSNTFTAIPADRTYRPPRTTPKPRISGLLTGVVDPHGAPSGRHANIDDQGRYTVRFLFDTTAPGERAASHPVRMLQHHAGENYGTHFPLKPGVEVLLAFVDGDPDRPLIVGAAPNPAMPSPVTAADHGIHRTRTSTGVTIDIK